VIQHGFLRGNWLLKQKVYWIIQGGATGFSLPLFQVFLFHLLKVLEVSLFEAKIRIQSDLSGERSNEGENIDSIGVLAQLVRFLEDEQGIVTAQKAQPQRPSKKIGPSADRVEEKSGVMIKDALGWPNAFRIRASRAQSQPPVKEVQSGFQGVLFVFEEVPDQPEVILVENPEK
jgi:hypothetical protein